MPVRGTHPFCAHSTGCNSNISNCKVWVMAQEREEWTWFIIHQDEPWLCWAGGESRWLLGASPVPSVCFWRFVFPFCNNLAKEKSGTCQLSFFSSFLIHFSFAQEFPSAFLVCHYGQWEHLLRQPQKCSSRTGLSRHPGFIIPQVRGIGQVI